MSNSLLARALMTAALAILANASAARSEPVVLEAQCLCKLGNKPNWFKGTIALTPQNREAMKTLIEAGAVELNKQVVLKGAGCNPSTFPSGWKDKCGFTSVSKTDAAGKPTRINVDNTEFSGEVSIQIKSNFGIPRAKSSAPGVVKIDETRWPKSTTFGILGPQTAK